jgi:hemerythrin superfamily protein
MNVITLLTNDHRKVERLFERYRSEPRPETKRRTLETITRDLSMHMTAEEQVLYPLLRRTIPDGETLMREAEGEHQSAKALIADLQRSEPGSFDMDSKVSTLRNAIDHHVQEEEGQIFPQIKQSFARQDLVDLGRKIVLAKRSAPTRPDRSAAAESPGASVRGVAGAAADRVRNIFSADETPQRKSPKRAARTKSGGRGKTRKAKRTRKRALAGRRESIRGRSARAGELSNCFARVNAGEV